MIAGLARRAQLLLPGLLLVTGVALVADQVARRLHAAVSWGPDAVVVALLIGMALRAVHRVPEALHPGVAFMGREVLEVAIVLLGCTTDLGRLAAAGPRLFVAVVAVTVFALGAGISIGTRLGLGQRRAILVASGNAICGNSAIAAVGRVIGAAPAETGSAIAGTALLSIALVLGLPLFGTIMGLDDLAYGALAGMTVYAMPQVLAATFPISAAAGEIGTMVKLVRVMLLVPWLVWLGRRQGGEAPVAGEVARRVLPGYLVLFLIGAVARTLGWIPTPLMEWARSGAHVLTIAAMAAVGLGVDPASLREAGPRTMGAAVLSLLLLVFTALGVVLLMVR